MMTNVEYTIYRIRKYLETEGVAKSRLAALAGVPEGCTRNIKSTKWNPTSETLIKLESVIPENYAPPKKPIKKSKD
jgi:hypothetical protein